MALSPSQVKQRLAELLEIPKKEADDILWAIQTIAEETVKNADSLTLPGIGKLDCKVQAARTARNPRTGDSVEVPAKVAVKFRVSKSLKDNAPSLTSKKGKKLLEAVEVANKEKAKRKRKRDAAEETASTKKNSKNKKSKSNKKVGKKAKARF